MALNLRHSSNVRTPDIGLERDPITLKIFEQINRLIYESFKNIFDDLNNIGVSRVDSLPTASADYLGRFFLLKNAGADDTLHICLYDGAASNYKWQAVTLT